jgi:hypothetical protein
VVFSDRVSFQNREERAKMTATFRLARGILDALVKMRLNHFFAERLERLAGRDDLHEHIRAVFISFDHFFNPLDLSFDFAQADDERSFLQPGTMMF